MPIRPGAGPVKGWANFTQATSPTLNGGVNVTSISRTGAGRHTVNWTNAIGSTSYAVTVSAVSGYAGSAAGTPVSWVTAIASASAGVAVVDASAFTGNDGFGQVCVIACG